MTDLPSAPIVVSGAAAAAPVETVATAPAVDPNLVVNSVVATVTSHPDIPASAAPSIIANLLAGLYQATPAIFAVSRSSSKTQAEVGLGFGLAEIILQAFLPH